MVSTRKHYLHAATDLSDSSNSNFNNFLKKHCNLGATNLYELSKKKAKQFGKNIRFMADGHLPWKIAIIVDTILQRRSSRNAENVKWFNHGKGFVIGHQWTNIVLFFNEVLIPLPPIAFHTKTYCRNYQLQYLTEHRRVIEYLRHLDLDEYIGPHDPEQVVVLTDSGYDNKKIAKMIDRKGWKYVMALKKRRSIKTIKEYANTPKSTGWHQIEQFFKNHQHTRWITVHCSPNNSHKTPAEFRARQITGYLNSVGKTQLICSEINQRRKGRRKYFACNDLKATPQEILLAYRIRWKIEIFHKRIRMCLGFEDISLESFKSVVSHVHWVYFTYILLHSHPPTTAEQIKSTQEKQWMQMTFFKNKKIASMLQLISKLYDAFQSKVRLQNTLNNFWAAAPLFSMVLKESGIISRKLLILSSFITRHVDQILL